MLDLFKAIDTLVSTYPLTVGGHTFSTMFASSRFDILTEPEGLLANMVATAFNLGFGQNLPVFSDQRTVTTAGFVTNNATTYCDVRQFVITPEPSASRASCLRLWRPYCWRYRRR